MGLSSSHCQEMRTSANEPSRRVKRLEASWIGLSNCCFCWQEEKQEGIDEKELLLQIANARVHIEINEEEMNTAEQLSGVMLCN